MKFTKLTALILAVVFCLFATGCEITMGEFLEAVTDQMDVVMDENYMGEFDDSGIVIVNPDDEEDVTDEPQNDTAEDAEETEKGTSTPLLYKVTDKNGNVTWLFGSIHIGREDFYPLPDYVLDAFDGSDALAVEADIVAFEKDMGAQMDALSLMMYSDGTDITDHISEELYDKAAEILEDNGMYIFGLDYYIVSLWWNFVDNCALIQLDVDVEGGIDRFLIDRAYKADKKVMEIESAEFQYGMMAGFSEELQIWLLEDSIEAYGDLEAYEESLDTMMDLWVSGDEEEFAAYLNSEVEFDNKEEERLYAEYNKAMLEDRNLVMTRFAEEALASGKEIFICVGAAHVVGEGAMAELLAERGYTVEIVR